jgi:hypothetical protein
MIDLIVMAVVTAFIGFICTIFVLAKIIRITCDRLAKTNEQLLILISAKDGGATPTMRALVASSKAPSTRLPGAVKNEKKSQKEKEAINVTMGITQ